MKVKNISTDFFRLILYFLDFISLNLSYLTIYNLQFNSYTFENQKFSFLIFSNILWILLSKIYKPYQLKRFESADKMLNKSYKLLLVYILIISSIFVLIIPKENQNFHYFIIQLILFGITATTFRLISVYSLKLLRKKGINNKNVLIIGSNEEAIKLFQTLKNELSFGYKVMGYIDINPSIKLENENYFGTPEKLEEIILSNRIDEVYCSIPNETTYNIKKYIVICERNFVRIKLIPNFQKYTINRRVSADFYIEQPIIHLRKEPLENVLNKLQKRIFDLIFSTLVIVLIYPWLFPIVFFIQKITSNGPVFFIQKRTGQDNKEFGCIKFRTMYINKDSELKGTLKNDPRITPFGKFLRKTRIDELPQFINVFRGQMSVVGPRPHMLKHTEEYSQLIDEFLVRQFVKPGITGWAQTTGYIDETKKLQEMRDKVKKDVWYIENWTIFLDLKIIALTILNIFRRDENAY